MTDDLSLEILVEEPSAERAMRQLVPKIVPGVSFDVRTFQGKADLLKALPDRLAGYAQWARWSRIKVAVVVDRDDDDCRDLRAHLDRLVAKAGLRVDQLHLTGDVLNRVVVEELEAWFFGDTAALRAAFPKVPQSLGSRAKFRNPDSIAGGTWEALERVLQDAGYHTSGLRKLEAADRISSEMTVENNNSGSFVAFRDGLRRLVSER